jgi:hypothetical protein
MEMEDRQRKERNLVSSSLGEGLHATAGQIKAGGLHPPPRGTTHAGRRSGAH